MAVPTVEDITGIVRALLSDQEIFGGEVFTDSVLLPFVQTAFREMHDAFSLWNVPRQRKTVTVTINANTTSITPAALGITDMLMPLKLEERAIASGIAYEMIAPVSEPPQPVSASTIGEYTYEGEQFILRPCSSSRDVRIRYEATAPAAPSTGSVGIDNAHNFLSYRTAGLAALSKGMNELGKAYTILALGPEFKPDGKEGFLNGLCAVASRSRERYESNRPATVRKP